MIILPVWELDRTADQRHLLDLQARSVPFVVNCDMEEYGFTTVASDERPAGRQAAQSILDRNHRHLLVVGCDDAKQLCRARLAQEILDELGHRISTPEAAPARRRVPQRLIHRESLTAWEPTGASGTDCGRGAT